MRDAEVNQILIKEKAVEFNTKKPYTFASGIKSPVYTDCRILISNTVLREKITFKLAEKVSEDVDVVCATASAGIPWGAWVADQKKLPLVYVRKNSKKHGLAKKIEGKISAGDKALVIDDLVSTGGSALDAVDTLREEKIGVYEVLCIFTYDLPETKRNFAEKNIALSALTSLPQLTKHLIQQNYLSEQDLAQISLWSENPREWMR
ncbi:MAG: orotate phosphoribosyltransferase [Candidatus Altiarchaeales archaeon]|nr:orotate phosphoribosyltransferase [Candidatus Altiarchaeales archaeon]